MTRTRDDVFQALIKALPDGLEQDLYALGKTDYIGGTLWSLAGQLLEQTQRIDALRQGIPATIVESLPEWEQACGLSQTSTARVGTVTQRRNAVLAALRQRGSFAKDDIRAAIQPYFLYADPSAIVINEPDFAALETAHTYTNAVPVAFIGSGTMDIVVSGDGAPVSIAGARLTLTITATNLASLSFRLRNPDGFEVNIGREILSPLAESATAVEFRLFFPEMAGHATDGTWRLTAYSGPGATLVQGDLFVEGVGNLYDLAIPPNKIGEGLGSAKFEWDAFADPLLLGAGYDLIGAQRTLDRIKPAHTNATIT